MRQPERGHGVGSASTARTILLAAVVIVLGAALGVGWALSRQAEHVATAVVMLHPLEGNAYSPGGRGDELVNLETEAQVLRSDAVARAVLDELDESASSADLLGLVEVDVPANTQLLEITAHGPDDATATERASTFASVYLDYRRARTLAAVADRTSRMKELLALREDERSEALVRLEASEPGAPERSLLQQQVQELTLQIGSLRAELVASEAVSLDPGQVVTPGRPVVRGVDSRPEAMGMAGGSAAAALVVAVLVARGGRRRARVVLSSEDLQEMGPPVLGTATPPVSGGSAVVARMRSAVLAAGVDRPLVVAVAAVGAHRGECHGVLVDSLVRARYELISVELGARESSSAMVELIRDEVGVDDVLRADGQFLNRLHPTARQDEAPANGDSLVDLAASTGMRRSLRELAKRAELVVVDCPGLTTPVGRAVLAASDAALIEVPARSADRQAVEEILADAGSSRCQVVGLVLVQPIGSWSGWLRRRSGVRDA